MKIKINNKKGDEHAGMVILYVIVLFIFVLFLSAFIDGLVSISLETYDLQNYILYNRALLSRNSFFKMNNVEMVDYGVVDLEKFNEDTLKELYVKNSDNFGLRVILKYQGQEKTIYLNKDVFLLGYAIGGIKGARYDFISQSYPVTVKDDNNEYLGILKLDSVLRQDDRKYI